MLLIATCTEGQLVRDVEQKGSKVGEMVDRMLRS